MSREERHLKLIELLSDLALTLDPEDLSLLCFECGIRQSELIIYELEEA